MVGVYPHIPDDRIGSSRMVWFGDEDERRLCTYCKTSKLNRMGRYYSCPTCNQRFLMSDMQEEIKVDFNVSKLDLRPALVFADKKAEGELRGLVREELMEKYGMSNEFDNDDKIFKRPGVRITNETER